MKTHLVSSPKMPFTHPVNILASLSALLVTISNTFFSDETQDITSVEQVTVYAIFEHNGVIAEHFVGVYPISKVVET